MNKLKLPTNIYQYCVDADIQITVSFKLIVKSSHWLDFPTKSLNDKRSLDKADMRSLVKRSYIVGWTTATLYCLEQLTFR